VDADVDRAYVGRLERSLENPTIGLLDRLSVALGVELAELLVEPPPGEPRPKPLRGGRRPREKSRRRRS
jgi:transcriptional regulator with XRE-family HTH domain